MTCLNLIVIRMHDNTQVEEILDALNTNCVDAVLPANRSPWSVISINDIILTSGKRMFDGSDFIINVDDDVITMQFKSNKWENGNRFILEDLIVKKFDSIYSCTIKTISKNDNQYGGDIFNCPPIIEAEAWDNTVITPPVVIAPLVYSPDIDLSDGEPDTLGGWSMTDRRVPIVNRPVVQATHSYQAILIKINERPFITPELDVILEIKLAGNDVNITNIIKSYLFERSVSNTRIIIEIPENPDNVDSWNNTRDLDTDFYELYQQINN